MEFENNFNPDDPNYDVLNSFTNNETLFSERETFMENVPQEETNRQTLEINNDNNDYYDFSTLTRIQTEITCQLPPTNVLTRKRRRIKIFSVEKLIRCRRYRRKIKKNFETFFHNYCPKMKIKLIKRLFHLIMKYIQDNENRHKTLYRIIESETEDNLSLAHLFESEAMIVLLKQESCLILKHFSNKDMRRLKEKYNIK